MRGPLPDRASTGAQGRTPARSERRQNGQRIRSFVGWNNPSGRMHRERGRSMGMRVDAKSPGKKAQGAFGDHGPVSGISSTSVGRTRILEERPLGNDRLGSF